MAVAAATEIPTVEACLCGAAGASRLWSGKFRRIGYDGVPYSVLRCRACGLARTSPIPGGGDPRSLYQGYANDLEGREGEARGWQIPRLADMRHLAPPPARVLDVGCCTGSLIQVLNEAGYTAEGLDLDRTAAEFGRRLGRPIASGELLPPEASPDAPHGRFDVVILCHTLEHVLDADRLLRAVSARLNPGGLLLIYVPNFASLAAQLLRNRWLYLAPPQHIWHFTRRSLVRAVTRATPELRPVWIRANRALESGDANTWWKKALRTSALELARRCGYGDELRAAFRKQ